MSEEKAVSETRPLSLVESFKLYVWTMWRAKWFSDAEVARMLGVMDRLGPKETIDFCFDELRALVAAQPEAYAGTFDANIVGGTDGASVEGSGEAGSPAVGGSAETSS